MSTLKKALAAGAAGAVIWGTLLSGAPSMSAQSQSGIRELESARQRFAREDWDAVLKILQRLPKDVDASHQAESELLVRRARLGRALAWADADAGRRKERDAASEFESLAAGPQDITSGAALIARAAIAWRQKQTEDARRWMRQGFETWRAVQGKYPAPGKGSLEEEIHAVHDGYSQGGLLGPRKPDALPYHLAPSMTPVDLGDGRSVRVTINRSLPHDPKLLFVNEEQETFLKTLLKRFRADWKSPDLSEKPSAGQPPQILELMREFINVRIQATGDMKRPVLEWDVFTTRPISITFQDELRERAEVCSSDSTGGSCLIYGKRAGAWFFTEEAKMWIIHRDPRGR